MKERFNYIDVSTDGSAFVVTLLSHTLKLELLAELRKAVTGANTKRLIITGRKGFFAAGADIAELTALDGLKAINYAIFGQSVFNTVANHPAVTIAAIDGYCMGCALDLALACN